MARLCVLAVLLALPATALAHTVADQLTFSGTQATATNPRSGSLADRISADFEMGESWDLHADLTLTHESATPPVNGATFGDTGGTIFDLLIGGDHDLSDQVTLGLDVDLSPASTTRSNTTLAFTGPLGTTSGVDAQLTTRASSQGATLNVSWISEDPYAPWQTALDFSLGGMHFSSTQRVTAVQGRNGTISSAALATFCESVISQPLPSDTGSLAYKRLLLQQATCRQMLPALKGQTASLGQGTLGAGITETIHLQTDVGLSASYSFYSEDPTQVGYFTLATAGRRHVEMGDGIPIAPVRWTLAPRVVHRFGALAAELNAEYAKYVTGQGHSTRLGIRLDYRFSKTYRAWVSASGQNDLDGAGESTHSGTLGAGLRVAF